MSVVEPRIHDRPVRMPRAVEPHEVPEDADLEHPALYLNKELGWLDFNWRVLWLAMDTRVPLLERVKFIAITASNLDEFVQKRVGGLLRQEGAGVTKLTEEGRTPGEQLALLRPVVARMQKTTSQVWEETLRPALRTAAAVDVCSYDDLTPTQRARLAEYFHEYIFPILTPLAFGPGHPFPFISNLSLSLAVSLRNNAQGTQHFVRVKLPVGRWVPVAPDPGATADGAPERFLPVEQLIAHHAADLFPGMTVLRIHPFRVTRNADVRRDEEEAEDLLDMISGELRERRFASVVRLEVDRAMPLADRHFLVRQLGVQQEDVVAIDGLLALDDLFAIAALNRPGRQYPAWSPVIPPRLRHEGESEATQDMFAIIRHGDLLVHHPYESFAASTQRFIEEAADDDLVVAIKHTLYRTSDESPTIQALIRAAESGKQVAVLVEVKARFDEANNMEWGQILEHAGVHVTYGVVGLKTHTKATLVLRREAGRIRRYCHIGTGNYNAKTARIYTDFGLFTCDATIGDDLVRLFHSLTGYAPAQEYRAVLVAPRSMRPRFEALIEQEIAHQEAGRGGRIIAKMNGLDDPQMMRELYRASQAGVQIDLIIRGHCAMRPGLPGFSESLRVISILGRFLEHDRVYYFHDAGRPQLFIGSADWRSRNLNSRIELVTPVFAPALQARLIAVLELALTDNRLAWDMQPDGSYVLRQQAEGDPERSFHDMLLAETAAGA